MSELVITGASDDLIEVDGDIREEFPLKDDDDDGDLLAVSDGTILRVRYTGAGVWRISPVARGTATLNIEQAPEDDDDNYTDKATLTGDNLRWVVHGVGCAVNRSDRPVQVS